MNSIEDRLTAATQAAARTVADGSAPPLRLPQHSPYLLPGRQHGGRAARLLAPVAAAAALAALAGSVVAIRELAAGGTGAGPATAARSVPRYFVALAHSGPFNPRQARTAEAVIGTTATGKVIARVGVPAPYNSFVSVSAASDDRTFVLAAQMLPVPPTPVNWRPSSLGGPATRFYQLRIDPGGSRPAVLTPLALPVLPAGYSSYNGDIALSPDGSRLAVPLDRRQHHGAIYSIRVYDLADGSYRTWFLPPSQASGSIGSPSWAPDSRHLALLVNTTGPRACTPGCVQLLDTTAAGGSVMARSSTIFQTAIVRRLVAWTNALLTTDGSRVLVAGMAGRKVANGEEHFFRPVLYDVSARSGQILSHLAAQNSENLFPLWAGPAARFFIVARPSSNPIDSISAAIYGPRAHIPVHLPARTIDAAW